MTLDTLTALIADHGPPLLFGLGFLEFIGAPIASVPILVTAGALARLGSGYGAPSLALAAAGGGLVADTLLFLLTRWKGREMMDVACGLTSNPASCVHGVSHRLGVLGGRYQLVAKFLPGAGNLIGPAAALARVPLPTFVLRDVVALGLWAGTYTGVGWLLAGELEVVLEWITAYFTWGAAAAAVLVGSAGVWRLLRVRMHSRAHAEAGVAQA